MHLKIICLNVWIGGVLFEEIVEFLQKEQPDIILLQEVYFGEEESVVPHKTAQPSPLASQYRTYQELIKRLGYAYGHFAPAFIEEIGGHDALVTIDGPAPLEIAQGNAILSKYPLREVSVTHFDVPFGKRVNEYSAYEFSPRNLQHVTVALPTGTDLHLLNTQGIWGENGEDSPRRLEMGQKIVQELVGEDGEIRSVILAGDFNVLPHTQTISIIEKKLKNVFKDELKTTFNVKRKDLKKYPGFAQAVVDMFFVSPDISVISHSCPDVDISDHLPLVVEVEV